MRWSIIRLIWLRELRDQLRDRRTLFMIVGLPLLLYPVLGFAVLQFAVDVLKVEHILVVGHYGCGGVAAAVDGERRGLVDHWLHPIREIARVHGSELGPLDERSRLDRLCELNVRHQVRNVASDVFVLEAWGRGQHLSIHGWIYSIGNGLIKDLNVTGNGTGALER